jgi:HK97 family phage major capsid protein
MTTKEDYVSFRQECAARMTAIVDDCESRSESLSDDETAELEQLERWATEATEAEARHDKIAAFAAAGSTGEPAPKPASVPNINRNDDPFDLDEVRDGQPIETGRAITAVEAMRNVSHSARSEITEHLELHDNDEQGLARHVVVTGSDVYRSAYRTAITLAPLSAEQQAVFDLEQRATITTGTGFSLPVPVDPTIVTIGDGSSNPFRMISTVRTTTSKTEAVNTIGEAAASWDAEAAEVSDDTPADDDVTVVIEKPQVYVEYTYEAGDDIPGLEMGLANSISRARNNLEASGMAVGTGTSPVIQGVADALAGTASELETTTASTFAVADVYIPRDSLGDDYQENASWVAHRAQYSRVRLLDTLGGATLWEYLRREDPPELIGYPTYRSSAMSSTVADGDVVATFGDFRAGYLILDRLGMRVDPYKVLATANNRPTGKIGLHGYWRVGANVVNINAFRQLIIKT